MLAGLDLKDVRSVNKLSGHGDMRMTDRLPHLSPAGDKQAHTQPEHHGGTVPRQRKRAFQRPHGVICS